MMIRFPPSPVSDPSTEVAMRLPRFVVAILAIGIALEPHGGKGRSIQGIINHAAEIVRSRLKRPLD